MDWHRLSVELAALGLDFWEGIRHIVWYFLVGIMLAGWIRTYKFHVRLRKRLPTFGGWAVFVAVGVAIVSPLCACGVLPIMVSLLTAGMPLTPCMALLVASPLMSIEGYAVTAGLLSDLGQRQARRGDLHGPLGGVSHAHRRAAGLRRGDLPRADPAGDMHDHDCDPRIACNCPDRWSTASPAATRTSSSSFCQVRGDRLEGRPLHPLRARDRGARDAYIDPEWIGAVFASTRWYTTVLVTLASAPCT
jgi:hypothetical protein